MIHSPIVFVLGAGASIPYGLPSGVDLRGRICAATSNPEKNELGKQILNCGPKKEDIEEFGLAFSRSSIASIDAFLARRTNFTGIGKLAIAACLALFEKEHVLFSDSTPDHWYRLLWNRLIADASEPQDLLRNAVRFVTFNYDRSLECFLHHSIKHSFGLSDEKASEIARKFWIVHAYGMAAPFAPYPQPGYRPYGPRPKPDDIRLAAESIFVMPEQRSDDVFKKIRTWFDWAERICFLGFGFDPLNMDRLGLYSVLSWRRERQAPVAGIYATTFGRTKAEKESDRRGLLGDEGWNTYDLQSTAMLRESGLLLP